MRILTLAFLSALVLAAPLLPSAVSKNRKGNKEYKKGKFEEAAASYKEAEVEDPEEKAVSYNLGNTLYRKGDFETAAKSYERALTSKEKDLKRKALFNAGNNFYREGVSGRDSSSQDKLNEAVKMYKEVLKGDPSDQAAKFNLQKVLEKLEQMKQQQQQQNKDQKNKDQKQGQDKKQDKQQQDKNKQDQEKKQDQKQEQAGKDQEKKDEKKQPQAGKPGQMSPEEAKQLLETVKQDEKEFQKKRLERMMGERRLEKDW